VILLKKSDPCKPISILATPCLRDFMMSLHLSLNRADEAIIQSLIAFVIQFKQLCEVLFIEEMALIGQLEEKFGCYDKPDAILMNPPVLVIPWYPSLY
jgi:hypothetical protein